MTLSTFIVLISWATFMIYWAISSLSVKRDIPDSSHLKWWWARALVIIVLLILWHYGSISLLSLRAVQFSPLNWLSGKNTILNSIGATLTALGIALAIWARIHLGRNWSSHPALKEGHELVTSGPYKLIRHPIYTGVIVAAFGSTFVSISAIVIFFATLIIFTARIGKEESLMMNQFPNQYLEYKKHTWALIPYVW